MVCLYCGKPLSFLSRLRYQRYCSEEHRQKYFSKRDESAFQELVTPRAADANGETAPEGAEKHEEPVLDVETIDAKDALQVLMEEERGPEDEEIAAYAEIDVAAGEDEDADDGEPGVAREEPEVPAEVEIAVQAEAGVETGKEQVEEPVPEPETETGELVPSIETPPEPQNGTSSNGGGEMPPDIAHFLSMVEAERHYYQNILDVLPAAVAVFMDDRSLAYCNRSFRKLIDPGQRDLFELKLDELFFQEEVREAVSGVLDRENEEAGAIVDQITGDGIKRLQIVAEALTAKDGDLGPQALVAVNVVPSAE